MPYKPIKPCAQHGCPTLTKERYCPNHAKAEARHYNRYGRDRETGKRYGRPWKQIRAAFLSANPLCVMCGRDGRLTPAKLAHHKVKLSDGGSNDWSNLVALCSECHSRLHARQHDYF
jgi:5-methylcytosine-specific restriction protein A